MNKTKVVLASAKIEDVDWVNVNLSDDRMKKLASLRFGDDKKRCALSEILLRKVLGKIGFNPPKLSYRYNTHGKPYLREPEGVYFSISHSEEYVVCAASNAEIGIDIERVRAVDLKIAKRFFSVPEYERIAAMKNEKSRLDEFYNCWTKKEAYAKWTGEGLSVSLKAFNVYNEMNCRFTEVDEFEGYKCTVCTGEKIEDFHMLKEEKT